MSIRLCIAKGTWGKVEWLETVDFRLEPQRAGMPSLTIELWHKESLRVPSLLAAIVQAYAIRMHM